MLKILASNISVLRNCCKLESYGTIFNVLKRYKNTSTLSAIPQAKLPEYEISKDEKEWEYVERLLPLKMIPDVEPKKEYPSGWRPQKYNANMPYVIQRSKNNMIPIYLFIAEKHRGLRRNTYIKKIHGDIWRCAMDIRKYLEPICSNPVHLKVHEITGTIIVRGDHVNNLKLWALKRNL